MSCFSQSLFLKYALLFLDSIGLYNAEIKFGTLCTRLLAQKR